jgi:hypothetical protein
MYEKIIFLVLGAIVGKLFDVYIQSRKLNQLRQALMEELEDLEQRLKLMIRSYERSLQIFALGGISSVLPIKLSNPIFQKNYVDVALKLGSSQRISYSLINSYIEAVNQGIERLGVELSKITDGISSETLERWGNMLKGNYKTAATTYWHVSYHLKNEYFPALGDEGTEGHKSYIEFLGSIDKHIERIVIGAKENLNPNLFDN